MLLHYRAWTIPLTLPGRTWLRTPSSGIEQGDQMTLAEILRSSWNQLIVVNMVLAVVAVAVCLGAPLIAALAGALVAGILLFAAGRSLTRRAGHSHSTAPAPRSE